MDEKQSIVPTNIFQTHKSMAYIKTKPKLLTAVNSWKKHLDFNYYFYDNNECEEFIKKNFTDEVYKAYMRLPIGVMKADLWRYCVIYHHGGIYADTDTICMNNPKLFINNSLLTVAPENETHLCQWCFSAPKNSPILKNIIDLSVKRILFLKEIKGEHIIHAITGPGVFTDGIDEYLRQTKIPVFKNKLDYQKLRNKTIMVFNTNNFHNKIIKHLFCGQDSDGWVNERNKYLI